LDDNDAKNYMKNNDGIYFMLWGEDAMLIKLYSDAGVFSYLIWRSLKL